MKKTPQHLALIADVKVAREQLGRAKQALRDYRQANLKKLQPKIGRPRKWYAEVDAALASMVRPRSPSEIAKEIGASRQVVRRILMQGVAEKRIQRLGRPGQHAFYKAVAQKEAAE